MWVINRTITIDERQQTEGDAALAAGNRVQTRVRPSVQELAAVLVSRGKFLGSAAGAAVASVLPRRREDGRA